MSGYPFPSRGRSVMLHALRAFMAMVQSALAGMVVPAAILAALLVLPSSAVVAAGEAQASQALCIVWLGPRSRNAYTAPLRTTFEQCAWEVARVGYYQDGKAAIGIWAEVILTVTKRGEVSYVVDAGTYRTVYWGTIPVSRDADRDGLLGADDACPAQPETFNGFSDIDGCPDSLAEMVRLAGADIDKFWRKAFVEYQLPYRSPSHMVAYTQRTAARTTSACAPLQPNNAIYCGGDRGIYYDAGLLDRLLLNYGDYAGIAVIAHEWAHSVQTQVYGAVAVRWTIAQELEADCLAGAYTLYASSGSELLALDPGDIEEGLVALYDLGDDLPWFDPSAHGTPQQRAQAFVAGIRGDVCWKP